MKRTIISLCVAATLAGCTTSSDRAVLEGYRKSETQKQLAMDNAVSMAKQQILLNAAQRLREVIKDPSDAERAVQTLVAVWRAVNEVNITKEQYTMGRILTMVTVGSYLYDKQGAFNVIAESIGEDSKKLSDAVQAGNRAAGVNSLREVVTTQPSTPTAPPIPKVQSQMDQFNRSMNSIK